MFCELKTDISISSFMLNVKYKNRFNKNNFMDFTVLYKVKPHKLSEHLLSVEMSFKNPIQGAQTKENKLEIYFPQWTPGSYMIRDFSKHIINLKHNGIAIDPHSYELNAVPNEDIKITYLVYAYDLSVRAAHVDDTHAFFNGTSMFFAIRGYEYAPCTLDIEGFDANWKVYTSLQRHSQTPEFSCGRYLARDYFELIDSPVEIGTPLTVSFKAHGAEHLMAFTGALPNIDLERIAADTKKICEHEIELFDPQNKRAAFLDTSERYVFLTHVTENSYGGLEHRSSTALICPRNTLPTKNMGEPDDGYVRFLGLVSHEYFHTWLVKRIVPAEHKRLRLDGMHPIHTLWIFEGFTSYFDDLLLAMTSLITPEKYLEILSKTYSDVFGVAGYRMQSTAQSSFEAWTKYYKQDENAANSIVSYYAKGALVALCIDLHLRSHGHSLEKVLSHIWKKLGEDFYARDIDKRGGILSIEKPSCGNDFNIVDLIEEATGIHMFDEIKAWAYEAEALPLKEMLEKLGLKLSTEKSKAATMNAKLKTECGRIFFANVYADGAAAKAGISAKDELIAIDGIKAKSDKWEDLLKGYTPEESVSVSVFRGDRLRTYEVILESEADKIKIENSGSSPNFFNQILAK